MYQCPNCGGNLKFDITSQQLMCEHCRTQIDPYAYKKDKDAEESKTFETTIFTCPQCGGQILSDETSAAEFCSFCGASTILDSRLSKEHRPSYIIPFKKTKEDCKAAYSKFVKHALFAPKELKDEHGLEKFRGIYMPYWAYYVKQDGAVSLAGSQSHRSGNYIITDHFRIVVDLNCNYKGINYDASSSFSDSISASIAPYEVKGMNAFTPSFLSGFYADTSDVDCNIYIPEACSFAGKTTYDYIVKSPQLSGYSISRPVTDEGLNNLLHTRCVQIDSAMFPVWFLSYRKQGRIAYATVNGQTGKVAADLPVSIGKYLGGSLLLAIPICLLLNLVLTLIPGTTLIFAALLGLITSIMYAAEVKKIKKKDSKEDDLGYLYNQGKSATQASKKKKPQKISGSITGSIFIIIFVAIFFTITLAQFSYSLFKNTRIFGTLILIGTCFTIAPAIKNSPPSDKTNVPGNLGSIIAVFLAFLVLLIKPVSDLYYYGCTILVYIGVFITLLQIISKYNILSTRPLPQFKKRGGDDHVN